MNIKNWYYWFKSTSYHSDKSCLYYWMEHFTSWIRQHCRMLHNWYYK